MCAYSSALLEAVCLNVCVHVACMCYACVLFVYEAAPHVLVPY